MAKVRSHFDLHAAAAISGLTPYMVDYLCRSGVLVPGGSNDRGRGKRRRYLFGDVVMLRALAKLLAHGISVARLKVALQGLEKYYPHITIKSVPAQYLCSNGIEVYFAEAPDVVRDLKTGQLAFAFVLEVRAVRAEVLRVLRHGS